MILGHLNLSLLLRSMRCVGRQLVYLYHQIQFPVSELQLYLSVLTRSITPKSTVLVTLYLL